MWQVKILHTPQSHSPQQYPHPGAAGYHRSLSASLCNFTCFHPILFFLKIEDIGQKLTTKCAQVGQRACPCWVSSVPNMGKHVAPKWEKTSRDGIVQKSSFSVFIFDDL